MLSHLAVKDFVTIAELAVEFKPGMTALTGETGAGKSILVDALGLVLGARASSTVVADGGARAEITASFEVSASPALRTRLTELDLETDDDECILRRTIGADGRSRAFVNGQPAPLQTLRELGQLLVDVHGQNTHLSLLRSDGQRELLDDFASHPDRMRQTHEAFTELQATERALAEASENAEEREARLDFLRFQLQELNDAVLDDPGEFEQLSQTQRRLAHASQLKERSESLRRQLAESDDNRSIREGVHDAVTELSSLVTLDGSLQPALDLLVAAAANLEEGASALRQYTESLSIDESALAEVDARLTLLHDLARKHRVGPDQLVDRRDALQRESDGLQGAVEGLPALTARQNAAEKRYLDATKALHRSRVKAAKSLAAAVTERLAGLGIQGGALKISIDADATRAAHGTDRVLFEIRTNPGRPYGPLAKIASGGELSRIGLAIHVVAANAAQLPCLVFDEVDAGIGGAIALEVGRYLRELAQLRQVLCVTHLGQVAAHADQHLFVEKRVEAEQASTEIRTIEDDHRVAELARMLGGSPKNRESIAHAKAMLKAGRAS
ncbi:MAG: DNA repair protein RecN [Pseudomonadota bacterium]